MNVAQSTNKATLRENNLQPFNEIFNNYIILYPKKTTNKNEKRQLTVHIEKVGRTKRVPVFLGLELGRVHISADHMQVKTSAEKKKYILIFTGG